MSTTLCFDFGNTRRKVAIFNNADIKEVLVLQDDSNATIELLVKEWKADKSILSSVINHNPGMEDVLASKTKFHKLNHLTKLAFTTPVGKPETIGANLSAPIVSGLPTGVVKGNLVL